MPHFSKINQFCFDSLFYFRFRLMSATVSDFFQKVAVLAWNWWLTCSGLGGRHGSESLADMLRIMQLILSVRILAILLAVLSQICVLPL